MDLPRATQRVVEAAHLLGLEIEVREFPAGTKTAADAAAAVGCPLSAIVKSMVFMAGEEPVVALVPGDRRLDPAKLGLAVGAEDVRRAGLEEVRAATGYAAGGTPPFGYPGPLRVLADPLLLRHEEVWVAGGTPTTVFPLAREQLLEVTGAIWADVAEL